MPKTARWNKNFNRSINQFTNYCCSFLIKDSIRRLNYAVQQPPTIDSLVAHIPTHSTWMPICSLIFNGQCIIPQLKQTRFWFVTTIIKVHTQLLNLIVANKELLLHKKSNELAQECIQGNSTNSIVSVFRICNWLCIIKSSIFRASYWNKTSAIFSLFRNWIVRPCFVYLADLCTII